jgi:hypothetical protein
MKLLNLFFVCLVLLWGTTVLADPPAWDDFPMPCAAEHGACFVDLSGGEISFFLFDPVTGDEVSGTLNTDFNDFFRENPDGSHFMHMVDQDISGGIYCPGGVAIPDGCWEMDASYPGLISAKGRVILIPDPEGFVFDAFCTYSAHAIGVATNPESGEPFRIRVKLHVVPDPETICRVHKLEIKVTPMN